MSKDLTDAIANGTGTGNGEPPVRRDSYYVEI